jgi:hypothetical protein
MDFRREVMDEAARLGLAWWERIVVVLLVATAAVLARRGVHALAGLKFPEPTPEPTPMPPMDMPADGIPLPGKEWKEMEP